MKKNILLLLFFSVLSSLYVLSQTPRMLPEITPAGKGKVNTRVDNIGYWVRMAKMGYVKSTPKTEVPAARFKSTDIIFYPTPNINRYPSQIINSPDVPVTGETDVTQSENSIFIDPNDENVVLNSNNSSTWVSGYALNALGADVLYSFDNGLEWGGSTDGINGSNGGDPSTAIGLNGWWYVGRITGDYGQAVSYSKNQGKTWTRVKVGNGPTAGIGLLDKNHLWIDNSPESPYQGYLYNAWTNFIPGHPDTNQVQIVRSTNQGLTWTSPVNISVGAAAQKLNHGVNLQTGPNGEVYAAWSIYDGWPADETAIGFAKSFNGGSLFMPATRIISNIKGIRASMTGKNMRVSSFPSMAVDNSFGPHRGTIYLVWANAGYPGINTGTDIDIYMIRSADAGSTWSAPIRVNQDPPGLGKQHYLPWITCDRVTGGLCAIYYDDRNLDSTQAATFVSVSYDGGNSWADMQVSDYTFTPEPIPGLAFSYFGDYIGIQSNNMKVCPIWTDNHDGGRAMSYVSPFDLGPNPNQPWVTYYSDSLATVSGNGNMTLNSGDSLYLTLGLKNIGDLSAAGVNATISTASPYIFITDSTATYGQMGAGSIIQVPNGYTFRVSDTIPDNIMVRFDVSATGSDTAWFSHFSLESHAPALKIKSLTIVDTLDGNRNGRIDAGETVLLVVPTANSGDFPCPSVYERIESESPYITLIADSVQLNDILPGQTRNAVFQLSVDSATPPGIGLDILVTARSGLYKTQRNFREVIGLVVEDWETNTFTHFPWTQGGSKPWTITGLNRWEGDFGAVSGVINDYQSSQMLLSYASASSDSISFYLSTSTEQDYDFLTFSIDGVLQAQWSGETPWTRAAFPVSAGQHTFKWIYQKDLAYHTGLDRVWVDFIALPPPVLPQVEPGQDDTICAGVNFNLQASVQQCDSIKWTTSGDGVFSNDTALTTSYIPGTGDLITGGVNLLLTGFGPYGNSAKDLNLRINPRPVAAITAFPGDTACAGQTIFLNADTTGVTAWLWEPDQNTLPMVAYDTSETGGTGHFLITLITTNAFQCQNRDSVYITFKDCTGIEETESGSVYIYPNPSNGIFTLEVFMQEAAPLELNISNLSNAEVFSFNDPIVTQHHVKKFDLNFLPDGIYLLSLTTAHGKTTGKLIIRK